MEANCIGGQGPQRTAVTEEEEKTPADLLCISIPATWQQHSSTFCLQTFFFIYGLPNEAVSRYVASKTRTIREYERTWKEVVLD